MRAKTLARQLAFSTLPLLLAMTAPIAAHAAADDIHAGELEIPLNKSQVISADRSIARAMIGNPAIADIVPLTDQSIYVLGKSMGTTSLTLYDKQGRVLSVMDVNVGPDVAAYRRQVAQLLPGSHIKAELSAGSMVLTGDATDAGAVDRAVQLAQTFAGKKVVNLITLGSSQQVMLEVRFAEVKRDIGDDLAMRGFANSNDGSFNAAVGPGASLSTDPVTGTAAFGVSNVVNSFGVFGKTFRALGLNFNSYLNTLESRGFAKTLAEPTLVALSGEKASFLAGGEIPIPVVQNTAASGGTGVGAVTVEYKPFGVSLSFTPTVLGDHTINLLVQPEVSSIDPAASIQLNGITIPGLKTRRASTTLELRDGESFAIAGLLQKDFQTTVNQLPLLGSIPILGALFRSTQFQKGETELLIVVTPYLVKPISSSQVHLPTDRVKDPNAAEVMMTGQGYIPKPAKELIPPPPTAQPGAPSASAQPAAPAKGQKAAPATGSKVKGGGYEY